jgi:hypothetical protein
VQAGLVVAQLERRGKRLDDRLVVALELGQELLPAPRP